MKASTGERHILIIGGAGYIGSVLTRSLLRLGYRVRVLDALLYDNDFAVRELIDTPGFSFMCGDFCDVNDLKIAVDGVTDVVMLAALVGDPVCRQYPDLARRINETGTIRLIELLNHTAAQRFVFMSTCSNYGLRPDDSEAVETSELNPQSLYAETKVRVEHRLLESFGSLNYAFTILRASTAYGISPRMRFDLTVNEFTRELALGRDLEVYDADTWRPYCHVEDIAEAIRLVLSAEASVVDGEVFNVGAGPENHTKRMIVGYLKDIMPQGVVRFKTGMVDPRNYRVSFRKIAGCLAFRPQRSVKTYMPQLVQAVMGGAYPAADVQPNRYANTSPYVKSA